MLMRRGDDSGMRTVESLRGRLLAEREASKTAKNEADLVAKRLGELERKLAKEIKTRNLAQKRLEYALEKLKLLNLLPESSQSSSEGRRVHPGTTATSGSPEQSGSQGEVEETMSSMGSKDVKEDGGGSGSSTGGSANRDVPQEESWTSSAGTAHSWNKDQEPVLDEDISGREDYQGLTTDAAARQSSLGANEPDEEHSADALALVPVGSMPPSSHACHPGIKGGGNVQEVLLALRHVKVHLRNSMERTRAAASLSSRREFYDAYTQRVHHE